MKVRNASFVIGDRLLPPFAIRHSGALLLSLTDTEGKDNEQGSHARGGGLKMIMPSARISIHVIPGWWVSFGELRLAGAKVQIRSLLQKHVEIDDRAIKENSTQKYLNFGKKCLESISKHCYEI